MSSASNTEEQIIRVAVVGATGWTGRALVPAIISAPDLSLVAAVARRAAGRDIGEFVGLNSIGVKIVDRVEIALSAGVDVLVDYSSSECVLANTLAAIDNGTDVVIGTSGLVANDFALIAASAETRGVGVIAAGNFSVSAAMVAHFSKIAARYFGDREILDFADAKKIDVPSGTAREIAEAIVGVGPEVDARTPATLRGPKAARGFSIGPTQVHSIRLPSYKISIEVLFGGSEERLTIRHDAGSGAEPYVSGTLLAIRRVHSIKGLVRGFDKLLFG